MRKYNIIITLILFLSILVEYKTVQASELNFAAIPTIPENQLNKEKTYFDLVMKENASQTIEVKLRNDTNKEVIVEPSVNSATTNINGVVEYGKVKDKPDSTLLYNLKDMVSVAKEVSIPAKSEVTVPLTITMPKESFKGILAGGITLQEKESDGKKDAKNGEGLAIENRYAYVIGLVIRLSDEKIAPQMTLQNVKPDQVNARNVITANLQNPTARFINKLSVQAQITRKGNSEVLFKEDKEGMQMAPNSNFNFPVALNGKKLEAGTYVFKATATSKDDKWDFEKEFTIDSKTAKELNDKDVSIESSYTWLYLLVGCVLLILLLAIITLVLILRKKKKEEEIRRQKARLRKKRQNRNKAQKENLKKT
ncbi:cell wall anchor protein [Carnobacterium maltaromaticum]|uniref:DUF916 and DUF3324 domain-containing protein n=1 Tax=Carnobacterium maltaromaticum TaxID=2751 RepID=UPI000C7899AB|nr:DUF916 and DUF3324 domain-containing protein [Carnobacterium maltaromaticum]PLS37085.1 cell wall anchor protein [Carnobacterium maltaromaticum]PLS37899.1 cell wall anchor protein [Carnobacterium maltaromaticum]PLS39840.1 cell wall anchor protein [Carnobacterium maltaromaticum]PLS44596.1 cell wall anchor protein [Carnobacterium maltaromaticum]PLS46629.1 cell wall anchor protein [Carnobacterium maltaromaticum]